MRQERAISCTPNNEQKNEQGDGDSEVIQSKQHTTTPALFLCPISLEIMRDPVIVCTGQTYDRPSIEKWIRDGHRTCPITMLHLHDLTLIPNIIVRQLIEAWSTSEESASSVFGHTSESDFSQLGLFAEPVHGSEENRDAILGLLRRIAKGQDVKRCVGKLKSMATEKSVCELIVESGGALLMASMLADEVTEPDGSSGCDEIISLLGILSRTSRDVVTGAVLSETGALECLIRHMGACHLGTVRLSAAMLLKRLLGSEEIRMQVSKSEDFLPHLTHMIEWTLVSSSSSSRKNMVKMLQLACAHKANRSKAVECGAIEALVKLLSVASSNSSSSSGESEELETAERALAALELLCTVEQGRRAVYGNGGAGAVHCVVRMLVGYSRQLTEHATGCLLLVCQSGPVEVLQVAMRAGARRQLLLMLQSDCTARAKRKALELLKLFHAIFFSQGDEHVSSDFKNVDLY